MILNPDLDFNTTDNLKTNTNEVISNPLQSPLKNDSIENLVAKPIDSELTTEDNSQNNDLIEELKTEIEKLKLDNTELYNKMLRIAANSENEKKQSTIDLSNSKKAAKKAIVKNILPFLTTINLSFSFAPKNEETINFVKQLKSSLVKLNSDFESSEVQFILPNTGDSFDPNIMQALNPSTNSEPLVKSLASVGCIVDKQVIQPASVLLD